MRFEELDRGAIMFFFEGMFMVIPAILIGYQFSQEVKLLKKSNRKLTTKSIPVFVFFFQLLAIISRIILGILCYVWNVSEPNDKAETWGLYIWGVQFYTIQYYFMCLCWVKLVVVFFSKAEINFAREHFVDRIFFLIVGSTSLYYLVLSILDYFIDKNITEYLWRIGFTVICVFISVLFLFYGNTLLKKLVNPKKQLDRLLMAKIKALLGNMFIMGLICSVLPIVYLWVGKGKPAQDWINFSLYCSELFNVTTVLIVFGRTPFFVRIRTKIAFPEIHMSKNHSVNTGTSLNSLTGSNVSEGISITVEEQ